MPPHPDHYCSGCGALKVCDLIEGEPVADDRGRMWATYKPAPLRCPRCPA